MSSPIQELTPEVLRTAFGSFPSGVTAVAAMCAGKPNGLAASSFTSVSIDPPLVSVCVARTSTTWPVLREAPLLGLSVLAEEHGPVARALGAKGRDRFDDITWKQSPNGAVFVHGAGLWLECMQFDVLPAGDHEIVLLAIQHLWAYPDVAPLVFHGSTFWQLQPTEWGT